MRYNLCKWLGIIPSTAHRAWNLLVRLVTPKYRFVTTYNRIMEDRPCNWAQVRLMAILQKEFDKLWEVWEFPIESKFFPRYPALWVNTNTNSPVLNEDTEISSSDIFWAIGHIARKDWNLCEKILRYVYYKVFMGYGYHQDEDRLRTLLPMSRRSFFFALDDFPAPTAYCRAFHTGFPTLRSNTVRENVFDRNDADNRERQVVGALFEFLQLYQSLSRWKSRSELWWDAMFNKLREEARSRYA